MSARKPRVAVVYNAPALPPDHRDAASESDVVEVAHAVAIALEGQSFTPFLVAAKAPLQNFLEVLSLAKPDLVFNLIEGFNGISSGATHLTSLFELMGLPYTGSPVNALAACVSKSRAKALLRGFGLPVTNSIVIEREAPIAEALARSLPSLANGRLGGVEAQPSSAVDSDNQLSNIDDDSSSASDPAPPLPPPSQKGEKYPQIAWIGGCLLVKPDAEDGSLGIDQGSVVADTKALVERVKYLRSLYDCGVIVEPYLPGPEFNLGVIALPEPRALAVAQIVFKPEIGRWPILTYAAKWDEGSVADLASRPVCPALIDPAFAERLSSLAVAACRATGCRDYARVDMRLDANGEPMILEVNPNPDIGPNAGWARAARASGFSYEEAIGAIAREALKRRRKSREIAPSKTEWAAAVADKRKSDTRND